MVMDAKQEMIIPKKLPSAIATPMDPNEMTPMIAKHKNKKLIFFILVNSSFHSVSTFF